MYRDQQQPPQAHRSGDGFEAFRSSAEDMEVAVVFGALHIPTVIRELTRLGYRVMPGVRWLTAIDYDEPPHLHKPTLDGWMDW